MSVVVRRLAVALITVYRYTLAALLGGQCRFWPSCSGYAEQAIERHGVWRGAGLAARRVLRCHPWHPGGVDLVPGGPPR
ncbi:MAG: membrane protein insertion efficiency factor YidD [Deltaproteobacteria bacterium]|nr:membrane protein insertion efficiency factor YidD [Deltaproteobacteria bacterium]